MTYTEIKNLTMLQLGEDPSDLSDYDTLISAYLGVAYWELMKIRKSGMIAGLDPLSATVNELPDYIHTALADYATFGVLNVGNSSKQQRAQTFYANYAKAASGLKSEAEEAMDAQNVTDGLPTHFTNLYDR